MAFIDCSPRFVTVGSPIYVSFSFFSFKNPTPLSTGNEHVNVQRQQWPSLNTPQLACLGGDVGGARWGLGLAVASTTPDETEKLGCWGTVGLRGPDCCALPREP